ncbi:DUF6895 family protein [Streptomyces sp. NPDC088746]|uniref:DUF6895 family protein n=1 Tax=Streptomyces sp. NPDC088746 TaxID=3365885 RepID=UPI0037F52EA4
MTAAAQTALLHRVGAGALDWLDANRARFRARTGPHTPAAEVKERFKPVGELGLIGSVVRREGVVGRRQNEQLSKLLDFAWHDVLDSGGLLAWLQDQEPFSPVPLELYVPFHELGYRHPAVEEHTRLVQATTAWGVLEAQPNRRLGISRFEARAGLTPATPTAEALRRTWLGRTPEPWAVDYHTAYAVTHTVFHLTDWGRSPDRLPDNIARYVELWLPAWIDEWRHAEHWDLLGELLVVDACLPRPALHPDVWQRYAAAQSPDGAMPIQRGMPVGDPDDVFDVVHHPTLVALLASAMATSRSLAALGAP